MRLGTFASTTALTILLLIPGFGGKARAQVSALPGYALQNGDVNGDFQRDIADAVRLMGYLFLGDQAPVPLALCGTDPTRVENGDVNGDHQIDVTDPLHLLGWTFLGGPAPVSACAESALKTVGNPNPRVVPVHAMAHGQSYGDWGLDWWVWALEHPFENHPIWDETGENCDSGQSGPVWFLGGTFGGAATRDCSVPAGKTLFIPLLNWSLWTPEDLAFANDLGVPGDSDEEILRNLITALADETFDLRCTVDGVELSDLERYRAASSGSNSVDIGNVLEDCCGVEPGVRDILIADGHWIMLAPLSSGEHTIEFSARMDCAGGDECFGAEFAFDVGPIVYNLSVE